MKLQIVKWEGHIRCVYLNNFRIAGGKPWGGGDVVAEFDVTADDLRQAVGAADPLNDQQIRSHED